MIGLEFRPQTAPLKKCEALSLAQAFSSENSAVNAGSLARDEMIAFGFRVRLDGGQARPSCCRLSLFHFNFSERQPSV